MKVLREPLLHFAVAALALFSVYAWLNQGRPTSDRVAPLKITEGDVQWLRETYTSQWLRPPDARELQGLVTDLVNELLLAREAQAMGLGENDTIVRRRLAQKLKFLIEDTSRLAEPTEGELLQYFAANAARFETDATISFTHVFFNPQGRADAKLDATTALAALRKASPTAKAADIGDRFLLDTEFRDADEQTVSNMFGEDFARAIFASEPGAWSGPWKSGYGLHLVFLGTKGAPSRPVFSIVRDKVAAEWRREREEAIGREYLARLREKYGVALDAGVKALLGPQSTTDVAVQ
jgi:parvulin-like peptidyl-prolyl isomerase